MRLITFKGILSLAKLILYNLYTKRLLTQVRGGVLPRHIALIPDGNRRFARLHGLGSPSMGHKLGSEKLDELLQWCDELAIQVVTVWALSTDNLKRNQDELDQLADVVQNKLKDLTRATRSIHVLGRLEVLPESMQRVIADAEAQTAHLGRLRLNIALGYDGREEITRAVQRLLVQRAEEGVPLKDVADNLTSEDIAERLYCNDAPDPDLIIRTSGELRLSGFMLWQSAYSELYFCDSLWPAFRKIDFLRAVRSYQQRKRRYGI